MGFLTYVVLPIVALTANAGLEHRNKALAAGMDGYLTKPINKSELREMLASFL